MLNDAAVDNVKTWPFENPYAIDRKYETFSGTNSPAWKVPSSKKVTVTFESFDRVEILSDLAAVNLTNSC